MKSEYIRFARDERIYGEKNLLQAQLELLDVAQRLKQFMALRKQEFNLKVALKSKVGQTLEQIDNFAAMLPKTSFHIEEERIERKRGVFEMTLQQEIEHLREKLDKLQGT